MREEEREGLKKRGLITFSWKKKKGGGKDVIEKGGFVDYLRYLTKFEPLDSKLFCLNFCLVPKIPEKLEGDPRVTTEISCVQECF